MTKTEIQRRRVAAKKALKKIDAKLAALDKKQEAVRNAIHLHEDRLSNAKDRYNKLGEDRDWLMTKWFNAQSRLQKEERRG